MFAVALGAVATAQAVAGVVGPYIWPTIFAHVRSLPHRAFFAALRTQAIC